MLKLLERARRFPNRVSNAWNLFEDLFAATATTEAIAALTCPAWKYFQVRACLSRRARAPKGGGGHVRRRQRDRGCKRDGECQQKQGLPAGEVLQAGQGCQWDRVASGSGLPAGQGCQRDRVASRTGLPVRQGCRRDRVASGTGLPAGQDVSGSRLPVEQVLQVIQGCQWVGFSYLLARIFT